jgi:ribosomal protein S18 acetylase RimI-like enzyme
MKQNGNYNNLVIRNITEKDIPYIVNLQRASFADMAAYGMIWPKSFLKSHIRIFPEGQFCVEIDQRIVGSASSLMVSLETDYMDHTWYDVTGNGLFLNHDYNADSLYCADISTHPEFQRKGIGTALYNARKSLAMKLNIRRIIAGGRLYDYCKYSDRMSAEEYAEKVVKKEIVDPVLTFQLKNGFRFIKLLNEYLYDERSLNYASFIEWLNPKYNSKCSTNAKTH